MVGVGFAAVAALGAAGKFLAGRQALAARQMEFQQQIRDLMAQKEQTLGIARSRAYASGIEAGSKSTEDYLAGLTGSFNDRIAYLDLIRRKVKTADTIGLYTGLVGDAAQGYGTLAALNNFWRTPGAAPGGAASGWDKSGWNTSWANEGQVT